VAWAAAEAVRCGGALVVARSIDWGWPAGYYPETALAPFSGGVDRIRAGAVTQLEEIVAELRDTTRSSMSGRC
jgi:hypothetical protein